MSDFDELLAVLDLNHVGDDIFIGAHPSKHPLRTFGGQLMAQSLVAASRTRTRDLPPNALSVHFINGGDPSKDIEFRVIRLRDERRFANRRVDAMQDGTLLSSAMISYLSGGRGLEHGIDPRTSRNRRACRKSVSCFAVTKDRSAVRQCTATHRMALHQRPVVGDA